MDQKVHKALLPKQNDQEKQELVLQIPHSRQISIKYDQYLVVHNIANEKSEILRSRKGILSYNEQIWMN